jgi:hypothetical protein
MKRVMLVFVLVALPAAWLCAQETKPVPKNAVRVSIPGCAKGAVFTVGRRSADEPGSIDVEEGTHLHMNGPKKMMSDIKGIRISPGTPPTAGSMGGVPVPEQIQIDMESWRQIPGECPAR